MHQPLVAIKSKRMPMLKVMALSLVCHAYQLIVVSFWFHFPERLKKGWRSAVYGFFKSDVKVGYDGQRKFHYFLCAAKKCKGKGGVRCFQDSKDHTATSNLRSHAIKCFGQDAVDSAFSNTQSRGRDTSIFAAFARQGQRPVKVSHRAHTKAESRWVSCWTWVFRPRMLSDSFVVPTLQDGAPRAIDPCVLSKIRSSRFWWRPEDQWPISPVLARSLETSSWCSRRCVNVLIRY